MPVYEYRCKDCNEKYEILHKGQENREKIVCPKCQSKESKKLLSGFSANVAGSASSCSDGNCGIPAPGGCASGMCGLN